MLIYVEGEWTSVLLEIGLCLLVLSPTGNKEHFAAAVSLSVCIHTHVYKHVL